MHRLGNYQSYVNAGEGEPLYACRLTTYQDGTSRAVVTRIDPGRERQAFNARCGLVPPASRRREGQLSDDDLRRSVQRTRSGIYDRIRQIGADRLLTLTVRENLSDLDRFQAGVKRFLRAIDRQMRGLQYVAVFEQQKRGAWHAHLAIRGFRDVRTLRRLWLAIVGKGQGNVDITPPRRRERLASYLAKYVAKNIAQHGLNRKRYWASRGIPVPDRCRFYLHAQTPAEVRDELGAVMAALGSAEWSTWATEDNWVMVFDNGG